jgi:diadenylate cyclase
MFNYIINALQFLLIGLVLWLFYKRFIKNTNSEKMVRGLIGLAVIWLSSWLFMWLGLRLLGEFARLAAIFLSVGVVVVFQPELRKFFAMMGHVKFIHALFSSVAVRDAEEKNKLAHSRDEIVRAVEYMSRKHIGALIVFREEFDGTIENLGTKIDAEISSELILTIFHNKTPLHDGAMIIGRNKILYAGAILPLTEKSDLNWKYGTRHRAAIGMSEISDSVVLVVSEETGTISIADRGKLTTFDDMKKMRARLSPLLKGEDHLTSRRRV